MLLKIIQHGDPVLRERARALSVDELRSARTQDLIALMRETMRDAQAVGIAAPQVGESVQIALVELPAALLDTFGPVARTEREVEVVPLQVLINPTITLESETVTFFEGCLSVPGRALVARSRSVHVEALDENGEPVAFTARGWHARILQHEIEHLFGGLYIDRMITRSYTSQDNYARFWRDRPIGEVLSAIGGPTTA